MKVKNALKILIGVFALSMCITACKRAGAGGEEKPALDPAWVQENPQDTGTVYVPVYTELECELEPEADEEYYFAKLFIQGGRLYVVVRNYTRESGRTDSLITMELGTGQRSERELGAAASYFRTSEGFAALASGQLRVYDEDFSLIREIDLQDLEDACKAEGKKLSCQELVLDGEGRVGIVNGSGSQSELLILDEDGRLLFSVQPPSELRSFDRLAVTQGGEWYIFCSGVKNDRRAYRLDMERGELGDELENIPDGYVYAVYPEGESGLYIVTYDYFYRYDTETESCQGLFCLRDYGVAADQASGFGLLDNGSFGIVNEAGRNTDGSEEPVLTVRLELTAITGRPADLVKPRTELVMAALSAPTYNYREPIMYFNKYNPDYYITVKEYTKMDYGTEDTQESYELAVQSFNNDLITGRGADIFWGSSGYFDLENLSEKGFIADLYEFMDQDEEINREDFIPNILKAMEYDGRLTAVSPSFLLYTLAGKAALLEKYEEWDFQAMGELLGEHTDAQLLLEITPEEALEIFLRYSMDVFYDQETGECSFSSPEFTEMLTIAAGLSAEYDSDISIQELLHKEEALLYEKYLGDCLDVQLIQKLFGEEVSYPGYPGAGNVISFSYRWAVSNLSENKEGAWEFIKCLLTVEEFKGILGGFPVYRQHFDELVEEAMQENENAGFMYSLSDGTTINMEPLTEEQARILRELVYSAEKTAEYDTAIYNIILEETQSYFAGQKTAEEVGAVIKDRVEIYLEEKR